MAQEMILKLNEAGMTSLHKAGLAGLYMTLKSFAENDDEIEGLEWRLRAAEITLSWTDEMPKAAFETLVKKSFRVDDEGFIRLAGLEPEKEMSFEQRHLLYNSLLNSFLQYGKHRQKKGKYDLGYEIDEKKIWIKDFEPITEFVHQKISENWFDSEENFVSEVDVSGWLYPGASKRHNAHKVSIHTEPLNLALPLLFAPVGVIYYPIKSKAKGRKARLALLIPEIKNLQSYSEVRQVIASQGVIDLTASSSTDAALRMLVALETNRASNEFAKQMRENFLCRVITFGIVSWNEKQKSRTAMRTIVSGKLKGFENYQLANTIFKNKWQQVKEKRDRKDVLKEPEHFFVTTFCAREMIADNIANNKFWYHNITEFLANRETREQLYYEQKEIGEMVEKANYDDENKNLFIKVCHESWRRRLGKLGQRARAENTSFGNLAGKEMEKWRTSYARCKNAETLRETVIDFWARGGSNTLLQGDGFTKLLPLFNERNWREARDLALLALISYKPQTEEEKVALNTETDSEGENER